MSQSIFFVENGHHSLKKHLNVICHFLKKFFLLFLSRFNASTVLLLIGKKTFFFIFYREKKIDMSLTKDTCKHEISILHLKLNISTTRQERELATQVGLHVRLIIHVG